MTTIASPVELHAVEKRREEELEEARSIQNVTLPNEALHAGSVKISHAFQPVTEVGGDFLDYFQLADGCVGLYLGDVSGKGLPAAMYAALAVRTLRGVHKTGMCPSQVLTTLNRRLMIRGTTRRHAAVQNAVFDPQTRVLKIAGGGMPGPFHLSANGDCRALEVQRIPPGLFDPTVSYEALELPLEPGDSVLFFADGLPDAFDELRPGATTSSVRGAIGALRRGVSGRRICGSEPICRRAGSARRYGCGGVSVSPGMKGILCSGMGRCVATAQEPRGFGLTLREGSSRIVAATCRLIQIQENAPMMKKSPCALGLAGWLSLLLAMPADMCALPQAGGQRAGEIARLIPAANIERGAKKITASPKSAVDWQDLINTQVGGRARVALDDGSALNVGSESSMRIEKHDAGAQQTQLELTYGKLRSQAKQIARPDGKFEVRTPAGVAGVVGTDFYVGFDNGTMTVIAFEGVVRVCNLAGECVLVKAGQMSSVRSGDNSAPLPPAQATLSILTAATEDTNVGGATGLQSVAQSGAHISKGMVITLGVLAVIPAVVVPIASKGSNSTTTLPTRQPQCPPQSPKCG